MDPNSLALLYAALTASSLFARTARAPRRQWDWLLVCTVVLTAAGAGWLLFPSTAGYVAGSLALVLILLPTWASNAASRALKRAQHRRAHFFSVVAMLLHPSRDRRALPNLFGALQLAYLGKVAEADARLERLARANDDIASIAAVDRLRISRRWRDIKSLVERAEPSAAVNASLLAVYVRALGELGYTDQMAQFIASNEATLIASGALESSLLSLFAFTGHVSLTRQLLTSMGQGYSEETRNHWLAVATQYAGDPTQARIGFGQMLQARDAQLRVQAKERFENLAHAEPELPPSAQAQLIVGYFGRAFASKQSLQLSRSVPTAQRLFTTGLIVVNSAVYVLGSYPSWVETRERFAERWAFFAPDILAGQWWRAVSYLFVHANLLHLLMNMGGLWVLGPFVERAFGRARFTIIYVFSGCFGSAVYLLFTFYGALKPEDLVGASGCIMGLLGASVAVMLRAWVRQRASVAKQLLFRLLAIVLLQVAFDHYTPQVAGLAHVLGLLGGFACGMFLHEVVSAKQSVAGLTRAT